MTDNLPAMNFIIKAKIQNINLISLDKDTSSSDGYQTSKMTTTTFRIAFTDSIKAVTIRISLPLTPNTL